MPSFLSVDIISFHGLLSFHKHSWEGSTEGVTSLSQKTLRHLGANDVPKVTGGPVSEDWNLEGCWTLLIIPSTRGKLWLAQQFCSSAQPPQNALSRVDGLFLEEKIKERVKQGYHVAAVEVVAYRLPVQEIFPSNVRCSGLKAWQHTECKKYFRKAESKGVDYENS